MASSASHRACESLEVATLGFLQFHDYPLGLKQFISALSPCLRELNFVGTSYYTIVDLI